jgi:hypothetical protein
VSDRDAIRLELRVHRHARLNLDVVERDEHESELALVTVDWKLIDASFGSS